MTSSYVTCNTIKALKHFQILVKNRNNSLKDCLARNLSNLVQCMPNTNKKSSKTTLKVLKCETNNNIIYNNYFLNKRKNKSIKHNLEEIKQIVTHHKLSSLSRLCLINNIYKNSL